MSDEPATDVQNAIELSERLRQDFASGVGIHGLTSQSMKINCSGRSAPAPTIETPA